MFWAPITAVEQNLIKFQHYILMPSFLLSLWVDKYVHQCIAAAVGTAGRLHQALRRARAHAAKCGFWLPQNGSPCRFTLGYKLEQLFLRFTFSSWNSQTFTDVKKRTFKGYLPFLWWSIHSVLPTAWSSSQMIPAQLWVFLLSLPFPHLLWKKRNAQWNKIKYVPTAVVYQTRFLPEVCWFFRGYFISLKFLLKLTFQKGLFHTFVIKNVYVVFTLRIFAIVRIVLNTEKSYTLWVPNYMIQDRKISNTKDFISSLSNRHNL